MKLKEFIDNWAPLVIGAAAIYGIVKIIQAITEVRIP